MRLICHVTSKGQVIKGSLDFMDGKSFRYVIILIERRETERYRETERQRETERDTERQRIDSYEHLAKLRLIFLLTGRVYMLQSGFTYSTWTGFTFPFYLL